ncbi:hypothetical protein KDE12_05730 [Campylobacter sp. faydin G-105]|uniref:hypothetical protein n=1 Tax=Campylobacter anatolicus TaxID=2829105 RepID=UPI001B966273|nr:hypothetical protein [Campylobacter anatolicus]MBR8462353.1 hypothetical protein [Campylobacter anatolicus]
MKKFIAILVLLSVCSFADTRYKNTCDNPVIRKELKIANSEASVKLDGYFSFVLASCVNSNYERTYIASKEFLEFLKIRYNLSGEDTSCLTMNLAEKNLLSSVGKLTDKFLDEDFIERYRDSVTYNECKKLIPGF